MLRLIIKQTNWSVFGALFGFVIGFFLKIYLLNIVSLDAWGRYVTAQTFATAFDSILAIGIPFAIIKFIPTYLPENLDKAQRMASLALRYAFIAGVFTLFLIFLFKDYINETLYKQISDSNFSWILFIMSIHIPISLLLGYLTSLYRSVLRIKEIVLYGTLITVTLRALFTILFYQYTQTEDIFYFIIIEVITQFFALSILLFIFNRKVFSTFKKASVKEFILDQKIVKYTSKLFLHSFIAFCAGYFLKLMISLHLPANDIGAYNILLALTGLTTFLLIHLNKVFAPAIAKLYHENNILELSILYKKTTFLINLITIPLAVLIVIFSTDILSLYTQDLIEYESFLLIMLIGGIFSTIAGSSGTIMLMAGLEKENIFLQVVKAFLVIVLSIYLIIYQKAGILEFILINVILSFLMNATQLILISRYIKINPFSPLLIKLFLFTILCLSLVFWMKTQSFDFTLIHFILIPFILYLLYIILFYSAIKGLLKDILT